jgi:hypothetical protein
MKNIISFFFPFCITFFLWYLSSPIWNPFGFLTMIPIFYYTFDDKIKYWEIFGVLICFLLDFNFSTRFLFTGIFLFLYGTNKIFGFMEKMEKNKASNIKNFNLFLGIIVTGLFIFLLFSTGIFWNSLISCIWLFLWGSIMYLPMASLFKRVKNDR